jgi:hypothetical protein
VWVVDFELTNGRTSPLWMGSVVEERFYHPLAIPVAGDDIKAKAVALGLVEITGFDALDAGALIDSWRQQPGTPAYCTELTGDELTPALDAADKARAPHNRDVLMKASCPPKLHLPMRKSWKRIAPLPLKLRYKVKASAAGSARRTFRFMRVALQGCGCCRA